MNLRYLIFFGLLTNLDALGMAAAAEGLLATLAVHEASTFAQSSIFSSLSATSHGSQVSSGLESLAQQALPALIAQAPAIN
ncbi:hypothetical protein BH09DEP1_BH09DEP1_1860 [soil metagenome]